MKVATNSRTGEILAGNIIPQVIASTFVVARIISKAVIRRKWSADDTMLCIAWVSLSLPNTSTSIPCSTLTRLHHIIDLLHRTHRPLLCPYRLRCWNTCRRATLLGAQDQPQAAICLSTPLQPHPLPHQNNHLPLLPRHLCGPAQPAPCPRSPDLHRPIHHPARNHVHLPVHAHCRVLG